MYGYIGLHQLRGLTIALRMRDIISRGQRNVPVMDSLVRPHHHCIDTYRGEF